MMSDTYAAASPGEALMSPKSTEPTAAELAAIHEGLLRLAEGATTQKEFLEAFRLNAAVLPGSKMEKAFQAALICREKFPE